MKKQWRSFLSNKCQSVRQRTGIQCPIKSCNTSLWSTALLPWDSQEHPTPLLCPFNGRKMVPTSWLISWNSRASGLDAVMETLLCCFFNSASIVPNVEIKTKLDLPISTVHKQREGLQSACSTATQDKYMVLNLISYILGGKRKLL